MRPGVAGLADHDVHDERRALEHGHRRIDAAQLHVARERLAPEADGEHGQARRTAARAACPGQALARRVGAVGQQHDARNRQAGQLLGGARERLADVRSRAGEGAAVGARRALGGRREAEVAEREAAGERRAQAARRAEGVADEGRARRCVVVGNRHAARVVHEHGEEVALGFDGAHDEDGPQQAEEEDGDGREAQAEQDERGPRDESARRTIGAGTTTPPTPAASERRQHRQGGRPGRAERQLALAEDHRPVLERQSEQPLQQRHLEPRVPRRTRISLYRPHSPVYRLSDPTAG